MFPLARIMTGSTSLSVEPRMLHPRVAPSTAPKHLHINLGKNVVGVPKTQCLTIRFRILSFPTYLAAVTRRPGDHRPPRVARMDLWETKATPPGNQNPPSVTRTGYGKTRGPPEDGTHFASYAWAPPSSYSSGGFQLNLEQFYFQRMSCSLELV